MSNPSEKYYEKYKQKISHPADRNDNRNSKRSQGKLSLDYDLFNTTVYPRALSDMPVRSVTQNSVRSFKSFNSNQRRNSSKFNL